MRNLVPDVPSPVWEAGNYIPRTSQMPQVTYVIALGVALALPSPFFAQSRQNEGQQRTSGGQNTNALGNRAKRGGNRGNKAGPDSKRRTAPSRTGKNMPISTSHTMTASTVIGTSGMTTKIGPTASTQRKSTSRTRTSRRRVTQTENSTGIGSTSTQTHTRSVERLHVARSAALAMSDSGMDRTHTTDPIGRSLVRALAAQL